MRRRLTAALLVTYVFAADSWFFYQGNLLDIARRVLLVAVPLVLLVQVGDVQLPRPVRAFLAGAWIALIWAGIVTGFTGRSMMGPFLLLANFLPFVFLVAAGSATRRHAVRVTTMRALFWLGALLSVQTIALFLLFVSNRIPSSHTVILSDRALAEQTYGIFGYANGILAAHSPLTVYRAQSWFGEPNDLALFLEATLAFGLVTIRGSRRRRLHMMAIVATALSLFLTFSTGFQLAALATLAMLLVERVTRRYDHQTRFLVTVVVLLVGFTLIPATILALNGVYQGNAGRLSEALGKSPRSSGVRTRVAGETWRFIESHPQGAGFEPLSEGPAAGQVSEPTSIAPLYWGLTLGLPGLALALVFFLFMIRLIVQAVTRGGTAGVLGAALAVQTLHQIASGSWTAATFLLLISLVGWELASQPVELEEVDLGRPAHVG